LNPGATAAQIQSALDNCPSGQVVLLSAGTYNLSSALRITNNGVTLRGAIDGGGTPTTVLNFSSAAGDWSLIGISKTTYPSSPSSVADIIAGLARGSTSITLGSAPTGLQVGQVLALDQIADENLVWDHGTEGGNTWGRNGNRTLTQFVRVTGISGNSVTFTPAIYSSYWAASQNPQAYWWGSGTSQTVYLSGMENLKVNRVAGGNGVNNLSIGPADSCWIKNVWSTQCESSHVRTGWTLNCEIRDSYFTVMDSVRSSAYAVLLTFSSATRVENNIMYDIPSALAMMSTTGSAIAYNFATDFPYSRADWLPECVITHGGHCDHNLFEGNCVPSFWADFTHGNASFNSYVRNIISGWDPGKTQSTRCINMNVHQDDMVVIGNVLGTVGIQDVYSVPGNNTTIYNVAPDSEATLFAEGNYNTVNLVIPALESLNGKTVANSYLYATKPAWFGVLAWPPVNPLSPQTALPANLPAGYRYQIGNNPPGQ
jgi:hypothetical protein